MQKNRLKYLVEILVLILIFVGMNFGEFQVKITKGKPPWAKKDPYTWEARILPGGNLEGVDDKGNQHDGWLYNDTDPNVNVVQGIGTYISRVNGTWYTPAFRFEVIFPEKIRFGTISKNVDWDGGESGTACGYPEGVGLFEFLSEKEHPVEGYQNVWFSFRGENSQDLSYAEIDNMEVGEWRKITMNFAILGQDIYGSCEDCNPGGYHNVNGEAHGYGNPLDIFYQRTGIDEWTVYVDTNFDNPDKTSIDYWIVFDYNNDMIREEYCECVPTGKGKKLKKEIHRPYWGRGNLYFTIVFTRTIKLD